MRDRFFVLFILMREAGFEPLLAESGRTKEQQAAKVAAGTSHTMASAHVVAADGFAYAGDVCDRTLGWNAPKEFWQTLWRCARIVGLFSGRYWLSFGPMGDKAHLEFRDGRICEAGVRQPLSWSARHKT